MATRDNPFFDLTYLILYALYTNVLPEGLFRGKREENCEKESKVPNEQKIILRY